MNQETASFDGLLTPDQAKTLSAAIDRIIPSDDFPSASQAGVEVYLRQQLRGDLNSFLGNYLDGLDAVNLESMHTLNTTFCQLNGSDQDALLSRIERGMVNTDWPVSPSEFFSLLVTHVMDGYYGATRVAFDLVGFDPRWTTKESAL